MPQKERTSKSRIRTKILRIVYRIRSLSKRKKVVLAGVLIVVFAGLTITILFLLRQPQNSSITRDGTTFTTADLPQGTPDFDTLLPVGKTIEEYGGWTRVSPSTADPVFAYADTLSNSPIRVSQQPLPNGFQEDTAEQVSSLARDLGANQVLNVGDTVVYIGTSVKGPQSLVLTKNNLLILIRSSVVITNENWSAYIASLQ